MAERASESCATAELQSFYGTAYKGVYCTSCTCLLVSPRFKNRAKTEMEQNVYSCLFLVNGVKSCNFVPLGVDQGSHRLTSDDITRLLWQRQQLANLVNAVRPLVPQLFLENKFTNQSRRKGGKGKRNITLLSLLENVQFLGESFPCTLTKFKQVALQGFFGLFSSFKNVSYISISCLNRT